MTPTLGTCCDDMRHARERVPESLFRVADNGVLYLTVGLVKTEEGLGFFDQAVFYCPFCGRQLQSRESVLKSPDAL